MVDRKDKRFFDFMCSCNDKGRERCDKVYDDVMAEFRGYYSNLSGRWQKDITDKDFVDTIVVGLDRMKNGQARITGIDTDMWSGIAVKYQYDFQDELECEDEEGNQVRDCKCDTLSNYDCEWKTQDFWIECDEIHHGLARAYQLVKEFDESLKKKVDK